MGKLYSASSDYFMKIGDFSLMVVSTLCCPGKLSIIDKKQNQNPLSKRLDEHQSVELIHKISVHRDSRKKCFQEKSALDLM